MGSHTFLFGVRELGREKLFVFMQHDLPAMEWLAGTCRDLHATTPERVSALIAAAAVDDDADVDFEEVMDWLQRESLPTDDEDAELFLTPIDDDYEYTAAVVVDVDDGCADFYISASERPETGRVPLRPSLPHALRVPWSHLPAVGERAGAHHERWSRAGSELKWESEVPWDAVDDGSEPSLIAFLTSLM